MIEKYADGKTRPTNMTGTGRAQGTAGNKPEHARQGQRPENDMIRQNGRKMINTTERALNIGTDKNAR